MLQFNRVQAALILVVVLVISSFAVPNLLSDATIKGWPDWAQRRIMLAPELQGGTIALLQVDRDDERQKLLILLPDQNDLAM